MNRKNPKFAVVSIALILAVFTLICLLINIPSTAQEPLPDNGFSSITIVGSPEDIAPSSNTDAIGTETETEAVGEGIDTAAETTGETSSSAAAETTEPTTAATTATAATTTSATTSASKTTTTTVRTSTSAVTTDATTAAATSPDTRVNAEYVVNPNYESDYYIVVYAGKSQSVAVYGKDDTGAYTVLVKCFTCSTGADSSPTRTGQYRIRAKYRWRLLSGWVYGQYSSSISSDYLFHSVPYKKQNASTLKMDEYDKLGTPASHGCIRLCVRDSKWIYDYCPIGTQVNIVNASGPKGADYPLRNTNSIYDGWDPSDPDPANPYIVTPPETTTSTEPSDGETEATTTASTDATTTSSEVTTTPTEATTTTSEAAATSTAADTTVTSASASEETTTTADTSAATDESTQPSDQAD